MITNLKVKNYALISDVELSFNSGMNIITGETGAGKSILIGALGLALGKRADTSVLRSKEAKCIIEAVFNIENLNLKPFFENNNLDYEHETILRREIATNGKSRAFINDTPVTLKELESIGSQLIEIHSQHDNLQLFKRDFQFYCLDVMAGTLTESRTYQQSYADFLENIKQLESLKKEEADLAKESDFNQFLFDELQSAQLANVNEKSLYNEQELLENAEDLIRGFGEADQLFSGSEYSIIEQLQSLSQLLSSFNTQLTNELAERVKSVLIELQDVAGEVSSAAAEVEVNPERLEEINNQLGYLFNLKSKHRAENVDELIAIQNQLEEKLSASHNLDAQIQKLEAVCTEQEKTLFELGNVLNRNRKKHIPALEKELTEVLAQLGMQHSRVQFALSSSGELSLYGINDLKILLSSDKGVSFGDLKKSASGGELARINLSIKSQIAKHTHSQMPCSIFDEIDTGVSGEIARKVGSLMVEMGEEQQVIVITHLPQIASLGNNHLFVYKLENNDSVETAVKSLSGDERINEIAKMISGDNLTEHAVEQSKQLLNPLS